MEKKRDRSLFTFKIHEETIDNINDIDLDRLNTYDINILNLQAGVGKTTTAFKFMKKYPKTFYGTSRHDIIDEHIENFDLRGFTHWYGFEYICKNPRNKKLHTDYKVPIKFLCHNCYLKSKCPYKPQFNKRTRVATVIEFHNTKYVTKNRGKESKFETGIMDEDFSEKFVKYRAPPEGFNAYIWDTKLREILDKPDLEKSDYKAIQKLTEYSDDEYMNYLKWSYKDLNPVNVNFLFFIFNHNAFFHTPIILMDATFHRDRFEWFLRRYRELYNPFYNPSIQIIDSNKVNKKSTVYVMPPHNKSYYRADIEHEGSKWLPNALGDIKKISSIVGDDIPYITYKKHSATGALYFHGLTSSNLYQDAQWMGIIGTLITNPKVFEEELSYKYFGVHIPSKEAESKEYKKEHGFKYIGEKRKYFRTWTDKDGTVYPIEYISYIFEDQLIQAFYRSRGLQFDRNIIRFGDIPDEIKKVFNVVYVKDKKKFFKQLKKKYGVDKMDEREHALFVLSASLKDIAFVYKFYTPKGTYDLDEARRIKEMFSDKMVSVTKEDIREYERERLIEHRRRLKNTPTKELVKVLHANGITVKHFKERMDKTRI